MRRLLAGALVIGLSACAGAPRKTAGPAATVPEAGVPAAPAVSGKKVSPYAPAQEDLSTRGNYTAGGLYKPGVPDSTPDYVPDVDLIPEPEVVAEPRSRAGNRATYSVLGKQYRVLDSAHGYQEQGLASYYGKKFHGRRTSNLEVYDMNAFTAAHKTLPLPSFARVTNLDNGKSVVVRVNDRGPFHDGRIVDLSYAAAVKLGITQRGTGRVEMRALTPGESIGSTMAAVGHPNAVDTRVASNDDRPPAPASSMDTLVARLPVGSAGAIELPPGVRIATGKPATAAGRPPAAIATASTAPVQATPVAPPVASPAASAAGAGNDWRFDMSQNGQTMSADEFDAWMKTRQVRVATGQPAAPLASPAALPPVASGQAPAPTVRAASGSDIILQVASFSARNNADRALAMLQGAGIAAARVHDGEANGRQVWRLRVGPLDDSAAAHMAARIAGLGFGPPQRVRD